MRNGLELVYTLQLALELMDEYKLKGVVKNKANLFRNAIEKEVSKSYDRNFAIDQEMTINAMNMKHRLISQIASLSEDEAMVYSEYANNFFENKEQYIKDTEVFITKI